MDIKKDVRKYALQNAIHYKGKANPGAVIGKLLNDNPELKSKLKELSKDINAVISEVNKLGLEKQEAELKKLAPELLEKKEKPKLHVLKPLKGAEEGKIVMRIAPSPSGPLHIGHAYVLSLNSEYCRMYKGKLILRIEDTNPDNIYEPAYDLIPENAKWLTKDNVKQVVIQSERLHTYYDYAEKLVSKGNAYICTCSADKFRTLISKKQACPCRDLPVEEQHKRFDKMFSGYEPGEAVMRIKTDVKHPNPAMRDWPAMRINHTKHPKQGTKHKVWPLMNFSVAIDDHELGVTHSIRGKDHMDNEKRQKYIFDYFGWKTPTHLYVGRINFQGLELSATEAKKRIEYGEYSDWDDIRLPFMGSFQRRGYNPEAFIQFAIDMGVTQNDKTVSAEEFFKTLNHHNKILLDPVSDRYFFIKDPVEVEIAKAPEQKLELKLHPEDPERGTRRLESHDKFYLAEDDHKKLKTSKLYRLMDCLNFKKTTKGLAFDSTDYEKYKKSGEFIMHWLPKSDKLVHVEVLMPDGKTASGLGETSLGKLNKGAVVQLERFGFCRLDKKTDDKLTFWFAH